MVSSYPGDEYCRAAGAQEIRYIGKAAPDGVAMTFDQWLAAGKPQPGVC